MSTEFSFYVCSFIVLFFSLNIVLLPVGFSFFFVLFVGGASCVFIYLLHLSLVCIFWACESLEVSLAGRVIFSFCVGLRCVECRASTIYLGVSPGWVAGLYEFFFSWVLLRWVRYD